MKGEAATLSCAFASEEDEERRKAPSVSVLSTMLAEERERGGKREVLVKWEGYDEADDNTWEPLKAVKNTEAYIAYAAAKGKGKR